MAKAAFFAATRQTRGIAVLGLVRGPDQSAGLLAMLALPRQLAT